MVIFAATAGRKNAQGYRVQFVIGSSPPTTTVKRCGSKGKENPYTVELAAIVMAL